MYNGKSTHSRPRHNIIKQLLYNGVIAIDYMRSNDNIADPLTKGLPRKLVDQALKEMGLKPIKQKYIVKKNPT